MPTLLFKLSVVFAVAPESIRFRFTLLAREIGAVRNRAVVSGVRLYPVVFTVMDAACAGVLELPKLSRMPPAVPCRIILSVVAADVSALLPVMSVVKRFVFCDAQVPVPPRPALVEVSQYLVAAWTSDWFKRKSGRR